MDRVEATVRDWLDLDDDVREAAEAILTRAGAVGPAQRQEVVGRFRAAAAAASAVADAIEGING